uniref:Uncharacterized protein n=1 Tax=Arundo donax TaxID=35708 RepID=A0A0A8YP16_ARUDO
MLIKCLLNYIVWSRVLIPLRHTTMNYKFICCFVV